MPPQDYDYSQWQTELGKYALPYGFNTFALYQNGPDADYMLGISADNCPLFDSLWTPMVAQIEATWSAQAPASSIMDGNTVQEVCDYAEWAYISYLDLGSVQSDFDTMRATICPGFYQDMNLAIAQIDNQNESVVTAGYMTQLTNNMHATYPEPTPTDINFRNYMTIDAYHMYAFAAAVSNDIPTSAVVASTELTFEVWSDNSVVCYFGDEEITLIGCAEGETCYVSDFLTVLNGLYLRIEGDERCELSQATIDQM